MKKKTTDDPQFHWWDKIQSAQRVALATTLNISGTTLTLTTGGSQLKDGHLLYAEESEEIMLVNGDPASETAVTVVRGYSGTTASAIVATGEGVNPNLTVIGTAYEEGSQAPTGINYDPTKRTNYTQIFRNTLEATRTASKTRLRTGDAVKEARRECLELHSMEIERAFWFGQSNETVRNGKPVRTTEGVLGAISTDNIATITSGATIDMETLEGYFKRAFDFGSSEKVGFCGNEALLTLQQVVRKNTTYNIQFGVKEFGMNVSRFMTPFGTIILKSHPLWNRMGGGTTGTTTYPGVESWLAILDMAELIYRPFQGDDTKWQPDMQDNGLDGLKAGYLTEAGLEIHHPTTHFLIKNLESAAADS
jgi:hypothetical protein